MNHPSDNTSPADREVSQAERSRESDRRYREDVARFLEKWDLAERARLVSLALRDRSGAIAA